MTPASAAGSENESQSLLFRRALLIEPSSVNVPRAKIEIVTIDKSESATRPDRKTLMRYS